MPAALTFPIGSRFYDWKYESEPEPFMNGRRDLPRPRQGARRLSQHQRDDLPARQPARLRALGRRSRAWSTWDYAHCLPYFKRMETCLAGAGRRAAVATARSSSSVGRRRTRCSTRSSRPPCEAGYPLHRRRQRLPPGGLRRVRPQHPPRPAAERGAGLPPPGAWTGPTSTVRTRALRPPGPVRRHAGRSASSSAGAAGPRRIVARAR